MTNQIRHLLLATLIGALLVASTTSQAPQVSEEENLKNRRQHAERMFYCTTAAGTLTTLIPSVLAGDVNTAKVAGILSSTYTILNYCQSYKHLNIANKECGNVIAKITLLTTTILTESMLLFKYDNLVTNLKFLKEGFAAIGDNCVLTEQDQKLLVKRIE